MQVQKDESAHEAFEQRIIDAADELVKALGIEQEVGIQLVRGGLTNIDSFSGVDASDIAEVLGVDANQAEAIHAAAKSKLEEASPA